MDEPDHNDPRLMDSVRQALPVIPEPWRSTVQAHLRIGDCSWDNRDDNSVWCVVHNTMLLPPTGTVEVDPEAAAREIARMDNAMKEVFGEGWRDGEQG